MSDPFLAEIKIVSFNYPPRGWALCNGQLLPINQNQALFALLGTTYGGNGQTTFALPNLRGRTPTHTSATHMLGEAGGAESHTLSVDELPAHTHALQATTADADLNSPAGASPAYSAIESYAASNAPVPFHAEAATAPIGGSQTHLNMQPCLALNFVIALQGVFPSRG